MTSSGPFIESGALGAALPKAPQEVKRSNMPRCECFQCGEGRGFFTRAQLAAGIHPCRCGGWLIPSRLDDCAEYAPDHLPEHPLYVLERERETRAGERQGTGWNGTNTRGDRCQCGDYKLSNARYCPRCTQAAVQEGLIPKRKGPQARQTLAALTPRTRAQRTADARARAESADMPF